MACRRDGAVGGGGWGCAAWIPVEVARGASVVLGEGWGGVWDSGEGAERGFASGVCIRGDGCVHLEEGDEEE